MSDQQLVLEDFPRPATARILSPNGRAHWSVRRSETAWCKSLVKVKALIQGLGRMHGQVVIQSTFIYPVARKRDDDNLATGVMKAVRDALVDAGYLEADDVEHVRQLPVQVEVQKGRRALILEFTETAP
jgi:Holliday junction resolvase RusA-like endonuclease